ncbi:DUF4160 domain-containing protein [Methylobacterium sp. J-077]|uniref:DUF4160 domain-containing protein n=1 Tax=Methylobacterium sp. J-077 TaxID=2836656 RepID=UPI001FBA01F7|nr:DUF4160 domain-containing protein [Methylobacterium sp. J-077]MCJ2124228.1 DUF4160 domain-containing protein [Methylobacterium sp. J-077]
MPVVAKVDGVQILFYANEHPPPHFHARIAKHQAVIDIETLSVIEGFLPIAKRRSILSWAATRTDALHAAFMQATSHGKVERIA